MKFSILSILIVVALASIVLSVSTRSTPDATAIVKHGEWTRFRIQFKNVFETPIKTARAKLTGPHEVERVQFYPVSVYSDETGEMSIKTPLPGTGWKMQLQFQDVDGAEIGTMPVKLQLDSENR